MVLNRTSGVMVGDALGMSIEFGRSRSGQDQITEIIAGRLAAGTFTDDTEMALALGSSLAPTVAWRVSYTQRTALT